MLPFSFIPGFRTGSLWKGLVAVFYYIVSIYYFIHTWAMLLFLLSFPFMFFSLMNLTGIYSINQSMLISRNIFIISSIFVIISAIGVFHSFFNIKSFKRKRKEIPISKEELIIHFLNIGQADSILIRQSDKNILIDGGYKISARPILRYFKKLNIEKLDYLIVTHPHNDHIGGLPKIINKISIENAIINTENPYKIKRNYEMHRDLLKLLKEKEVNIIHPNPGDSYYLGNGYFTILAPNSYDYNRINDYSIVIKYIYGNNSFLFTGDAEQFSGMEILKGNKDIGADLLKVGHHGSCTSSSEEFINAVNPKYAVISVGWWSFYGQPDKCILDRLENIGARLYRTDKLGTIIVKSDGNNIKFNKNALNYPRVKIPYTSVRLKYRALHGGRSVDS
ncbi:MAG: MBL fold metallo-hydrolase [Tissierellia bacterium]|nr:MBL fold metallo-hydrolase [Tissierellia bacterium]